MAIRRYAQRLLNPFRGAMQIIEHDGAEAVTVDGRHWDIYVRDLKLVEDLAAAGRVQTSEIRYGSWSERDGLKRGAIYPSDHFLMLEHRGARLYEYLLQQHRNVPFAFADRFELWLLDPAGRPLCLLNSVIEARDIDLDCIITWRPGYDCEQHFRPQTDPDPTDVPAAARLARQINDRAGTSPRAQWFERQDDGSGRALGGVNLKREDADRVLPPGAFPVWFVRPPQNGNLDELDLLQRFFEWQAPWLLLLHDLTPDVRRRLEALAAGRALAVEKNHRLYPEVLDEDAIRRARVEAALRGNRGDPRANEDVTSTFYIELNISRTN